MYCPRCGSEVKNSSLRCDYCGVKINMVCPACQSLTPFGKKNCTSCGFKLMKHCPSCKCVNLSTAETCRKCGSSLLEAKTHVVQKDAEEQIIEEKPIEEKKEVVREKRVINQFYQEESIINEPEAKEDFSEDIIEETVIEKPTKEVVSEETTPQEIVEEPISKDIDKAFYQSADEAKETEPEKETAKAKETSSPGIEITYYSQIQAKQKIVNTVKNSKERFVIAVNGDEGSGKSIVLQYVMKDLQSENIVSLWGECSPLTQISNFGFFQDAFLRLLSLPTFITNPELFVKNNKKVFENIFTLLTPDEITEFMNFLYPSKKGNFEKIVKNKLTTFNILEKVIKSILTKNKIIIVADDFDLLDGASFEFLMHLVDNGYFENGLKLIVAYKERRVAQSYFYSNNLPENVYENIYLDNLPQEQIETFIGNFVNHNLGILPPDVLCSIYQNCGGSASYVEQVMALLHDKKYLYFEKDQVSFNNFDDELSIIPVNITEVVKQRLKALSPMLRNTLFIASIMGYEFDAQILTNALNLPDEQVDAIIKQLKELLYIVPINQYTYAFKGLSLWRYIYDEAKTDELFNENNKKLFNILNSCVLSNNSIKAIVAQNISDDKTLFNMWSENSELTSYIGDINLYVISQKQCLKILSENSFENSQELYNDICEKIGKLLYKSNPVEAITYLSNVISNAKKTEDTNKIIDLCGYLVTSCYIIGNYHGVVEAVDLIIGLIKDEATPLEVVLVKSRKLKALHHIGNCEEVVNVARNEILPVLEEALSKSNAHKNLSLTLIYESWLEVNLTLANSYALQGNDKCIELIDNVLEIMHINKLESKYYETKAAISKALAYTMIGKVKESYVILEDVTKAYQDDVLNNELLSQWNLINVTNQILSNNFANLKEELFALATFANNTNDNFSKNIIKTILGYIIQKDGNLAKALEIYNEQITYFAKEKIAIGALLTWYLIAQITLTTDGADKALDIATKALEVAQNPKIKNYNVIVYLQKFIAETYIIKGDLDATKMYLEKSLLIAKQFGMKYAQVQLYMAFAKYFEEVISVKVVNKSENALSALNMYEYALSMAIELDLENLINEANKSKAAFKTYCQLNSIDI